MPFLLWFAIGACIVLLTAYFTTWMQDEPGNVMIPFAGTIGWPILLVVLLASKVTEAGERRRERVKELAKQRERDEYEARRLLAKEGLDL